VASPIRQAQGCRARLRFLVGLSALAFVHGCASVDPRAEACPDLSGRYHSRAEQETDSLLVYLLDNRAAAPNSVVLQSTADGLLISAGDTKQRLAHPEDYTCKQGAELLLSRHPTTYLKLPPLIDQSVVRSYTFRRTPSGDLALDIYAQSIGRPYGVKLSSPVKLEKTIVWKRLASRS